MKMTAFEKVWFGCFAVFVIVLIAVAVCGCADNQSEMRASLETLRDIAESGNVKGKLDVHLAGTSEVGMKEGLYFGSPGSIIRGSLEYQFKEKTAKTE